MTINRTSVEQCNFVLFLYDLKILRTEITKIFCKSKFKAYLNGEKTLIQKVFRKTIQISSSLLESSLIKLSYFKL